VPRLLSGETWLGSSRDDEPRHRAVNQESIRSCTPSLGKTSEIGPDREHMSEWSLLTPRAFATGPAWVATCDGLVNGDNPSEDTEDDSRKARKR
jgi:hypothetical protein